MNFLCDKCKQKYHVADEKLAGRAVTRFRCKKCEHIIELRAPATASTPASAQSTPPASASTPPGATVTRAATGAMPVARTTARPRPATTTGPAYGAVPARQATMPPTSAARPAGPGSPDHGWYAGIRDVPVGPLSRRDLAARVAAGDVTADTLVWREGIDDWRPLSAVAELADIARTAPSEARHARSSAAHTPSRPTPRASIDDDDEEATRVSGLDPSLAGLVARTIRPVEAARTADKPVEKAPEKPAEKPRAGAALSPLALSATRSSPGTPDRPAESAEKPTSGSAPQSGPVPTAAERHDSGETLVSGALEKAPATPAPSMDELSASLPRELLATPAPPPPAEATASTPISAPAPEPSLPPATPSTAAPVPSAAPVAAPAASSAAPLPARPAAAPAKPAAPGGLPASAWALLAGVLVLGIGGGLYLGQRHQPSDVDAQAEPRALQTLQGVDPRAGRAAEIAQHLRDSGIVTACWQESVRQNPALQPTTVTVDMGVDAQGHFQRVTVNQSPDPRFEACLRARLATVPPVRAGEAAEARTAVQLTVTR